MATSPVTFLGVIKAHKNRTENSTVSHPNSRLATDTDVGRFCLVARSPLAVYPDEITDSTNAQRLLETNKVLRKYRSGSAMLLRDLKDYLQDTLRMIPQTRIFSQLDDDKDEDEDYNETIQEEDEEQRRKEMKDGVLKPQMSNKNFLISPLDSQPMGWEQARDGMVKEAIRDEIKILQGTELKLAQSKDWSATGKASRGKFLFWGMEVMAQDTLRKEEGFKGLEQDKDSTRIKGQKSRRYRIKRAEEQDREAVNRGVRNKRTVRRKALV
ncbi:hypothetical protein PPACK8108_LOCUS22760 [Phakopsora pachyrhizi]|uniref:Uncharacterized protein n=1 Tax=Phakopsora pachyrhizi TaxID=170000 RepID=A0AAV0BN20_PHAPC|nr:hypothetical protein PPACK8108_LOCUS22760 [Phakopsora pachyrhizi]